MTITNKGRALALKLAPAIGTTNTIQEICSAIARVATTHHRLMERECNGPPIYSMPGAHLIDSKQLDEIAEEWERALERRIERCENRLAALVARLPETDDGPFGLRLSGDPRGCTVKLTGPTQLYDDWGHEGICVPQQ